MVGEKGCDTMLTEADFYIDEPVQLYRGYTHGETWNGWECPYFTLDVATTIADRYSEASGHPAGYDDEEDCVYFSDPDWPEPESFAGIDVVDGEGQVRHLYPVGAGSWVWVMVEG